MLGLVLAGCSSATDEPGAEPSVADGSAAEGSTDAAPDAPTESPTADVSVPEGAEVTAQGADLDFGDTATVVFEPDQKRETLLDLTVKRAREGRSPTSRASSSTTTTRRRPTTTTSRSR